MDFFPTAERMGGGGGFVYIFAHVNILLNAIYFVIINKMFVNILIILFLILFKPFKWTFDETDSKANKNPDENSVPVQRFFKS